jgi:hypothetical protein
MFRKALIRAAGFYRGFKELPKTEVLEQPRMGKFRRSRGLKNPIAVIHKPLEYDECHPNLALMRPLPLYTGIVPLEAVPERGFWNGSLLKIKGKRLFRCFTQNPGC